MVIGILSGLLRVKEIGEGSVVDAAIVDGSAHMMNLWMSMQETGSVEMKRGQSLLVGLIGRAVTFVLMENIFLFNVWSLNFIPYFWKP